MAYSVNEEMAASYVVEITGVERSKKELKQLGDAIRELRKGTGSRYTPGVTMTVASSVSKFGDNPDILVTRFEEMEGRILGGVRDAMKESVDLGKRTQAEHLQAAETDKGRSGKPKGRGGPGRDVSGAMIRGIRSNVEVLRGSAISVVTGWHGWGTDNRGDSESGRKGKKSYFSFQERGTKGRGGGTVSPDSNAGLSRAPNKQSQKIAGKRRAKGAGVPAANSLGLSIPTVREHLKAELGKLKR